jgi:NAD(P)H-flavin reductase/hemoglobin-like flavoprotein
LPCKFHETCRAGSEGRILLTAVDRKLRVKMSVPKLVRWRQRDGRRRQLDVARLRKNFAQVAEHGDEVPLFFYSDLFIKHPEVRDMFPISMEAQRGHLVDALVKIVSNVDSPQDLTAFLQGLGRDHRKFGVALEHYEAVGASLLTTLEYFSGPDWTPDLQADWAAAYEIIGSVMGVAAQEDEALRPAWWRGTVVSYERRSFDVSVLHVQPEPAMEYLAGQSVAIESPSRPRLWRYYSMANAPRPDTPLEFHIRMIDGGAVSMALTSTTAAGTELRLGPPIGVLTLRQPVPDRSLLLIAGSTGLAPMKAIVDQLTGVPDPPDVHLFFGARRSDGLYDLDSLEKMAAQHSWLTVTPAVSADTRFDGEVGSLPDVVARSGDWSGHDAYIAGPTQMVQDSAARLAAAGVPSDQIHIEDFGWSEP